MSDGFVAPAAVPPHMRRPAPVPPGARPVRPLPGADSPALLPRPQASATAPGLAQSTWEAYYDECHTVRVPAPCGGEDAFRVYVAGDAEGPVLVLLHGGGLSAMSYALATQSLKRKATVLALDFRGHGATETIDEADLSKDRLVADVAAVLRAFFEGRGGVPPLLLVGHSLGGAIAVWVAAERKELPVQGLAVIDVVEGSALDSLKHMNAFLDSRPSSFPSVDRAVAWATSGGGMRNGDSAGVSMPAQLKAAPGLSGDTRWHWRTDLRASEPYWRGWFEGMSEAFLAQTGMPKLLLLAGSDRLDKPLTIAHMQGQFQLGLVYGTGHYMMEDKPQETAQRLVEFHQRLVQVSRLNARLKKA